MGVQSTNYFHCADKWTIHNIYSRVYFFSISYHHTLFQKTIPDPVTFGAVRKRYPYSAPATLRSVACHVICNPSKRTYVHSLLVPYDNIQPELEAMYSAVELWWHTVTHGRGSEGETGEWSGYPVSFTLPRNMAYPALLPLMCTPRLPVVGWTDVPYRFKWTRPFRRKTKSGFCACANTFQTQSDTA